MTFDHAGDESFVREVDRFGVVRRGDFGGGTDGGDVIALDEHGPVLMQLLSVEDGGGAKKKRRGRNGIG